MTIRIPTLALLAAIPFASPAAAQDLVTFRTPSDNIHCLASAGPPAFVDCEVRESTAAAPPRPAGCDFDWGRRFLVEEAGAARPICAGDTVVDPSAPVLGYGNSAAFGAVTCLSTEEGLRCLNRDGGGFDLARGGQRVF